MKGELRVVFIVERFNRYLYRKFIIGFVFSLKLTVSQFKLLPSPFVPRWVQPINHFPYSLELFCYRVEALLPAVATDLASKVISRNLWVCFYHIFDLDHNIYIASSSLELLLCGMVVGGGHLVIVRDYLQFVSVSDYNDFCAVYSNFVHKSSIFRDLGFFMEQ